MRHYPFFTHEINDSGIHPEWRGPHIIGEGAESEDELLTRHN